MTEKQFMETLTAALSSRHVEEIGDILEEYRAHFLYKRSDGYTEEEICKKLGDPTAIAAQYDAAPTKSGAGKRFLQLTGLAVADFFFGVLCVLLGAFAVVMAALVLACAVAAVALIAYIEAAPIVLVPAMPYPCALLFGLSMAALTALTFVGTVYLFRFIGQLCRAYCRFHGNVRARAAERPTLPALSPYPQIAAATGRRLRRTALIGVVAFAVFLTVGFIVSAITAGSFEFWHAFGWFM